MARLVFGLALLLAALGATAQALPQPVEHHQTLTIGKISDDPQTDLEGLRPLLDFVVARMADLGVAGGDIVIARDQREMVSYLRQGKIDWVTETIGTALLLRARTNVRIALQRWKFGERGYRASVFVREDSDIHDLGGLVGHTVGFEHPGSTTGFMVPAVEMYRRGLPIALMGSPREKPPAHMIGYFFSGDEINTSTWVHKRLVDAGAVADTDWRRAYQVPYTFQNDLRVIFRSEPLPRAVEMFRQDLPAAIEQRLIEILTTAHETEEGLAVLSRFQATTRFEPYDPEQWPYVEGLWQDLNALLSEIH